MSGPRHPAAGQIDWEKVAGVLRARDSTELIQCPHCAAQGVVPYIAEHLLTAHPASSEANKVRRIVSEDLAQPARPHARAPGQRPAKKPGPRRPVARRRREPPGR